MINSIFDWLSFRLPYTGRKQYQKLIKNNLINVKTVLDVGCGPGVFKVYRDYDTTGIDISEDDLKKAEENGNYKTLIRGDVTKLPFPDKSFDAITCIELIEHLKKEEGFDLLDKLEHIARKVVIVTTPWGNDLALKGKTNPYLEHQSGWLPEEFVKRGYKIYPFYRPRWRFRSSPFSTIMLYIFGIIGKPLVILFPEKLSNDFAAVKIIAEKT